MSNATSNIAWIDVETDGLDARGDHLLEIACIVTDSELNILDERGFHALVKYEKHEVDKMRESAALVVREMHDKTGLWGRLWGHTRALPLSEIDARLFKYLRGFGRTGEMPVGGNSVRLDMNFMDQHLPKVASHLSYQMRDVSTVAGLAKAWDPDLPHFQKYSDHTAMVDIKESIRELKHYRETVFRSADEQRVHQRMIAAERELTQGVPELLRRRAAKEAPNAAEALRFMAEVFASGKELPESMLGPVSETRPPLESLPLAARDAYVAEVMRFLSDRGYVITFPKGLDKELAYLSELVVGTKSGELVPLAGFTRERIATALKTAATMLSSAAGVSETDEWCREESCQYRHWRSGSMPTHRRGAGCPQPKSITCPTCHRESFSPDDIREGYCGYCHDWTSR